MNDPFKIKEIKNVLVTHKIVVCVLLETRVKEQNASKVHKKLGKEWVWVNNYSHSTRGRIWIGWRPGWVHITVTQVHEQFMVCTLKNQDHQITLVAVYGLHNIADRRALWSGLSHCIQHQDPMIIIGDFNVVCNANDRLNGNLITDAETEHFQNFLLQYSLIEARST